MTRNLLAVFITGSILGFAAGNLLRPTTTANSNAPINSLRLEGFNFISPLLACDTRHPQNSTNLKPLESRLNHLIQQSQAKNQVDAVSVYIRQFQTGDILLINSEEKYNPASLIKIPLMIAAYQKAQHNPNYLSTRFTYNPPDYNQNQEIRPQISLQTGQSYTLDDAVNLLIKYSDNNAYYLLTKHLNLEGYATTYKDLQISLAEASDSKDYLSVEDFSYFFRILYNATYLNKDYSQKALQLLSQSTYTNGLVAGLPENTNIAHKYGLKNITEAGAIIKRELHDCGIVYLPQNPYLICVMTKSQAPVTTIESFIQSISSTTYEALNSSAQ